MLSDPEFFTEKSRSYSNYVVTIGIPRALEGHKNMPYELNEANTGGPSFSRP